MTVPPGDSTASVSDYPLLLLALVVVVVRALTNHEASKRRVASILRLLAWSLAFAMTLAVVYATVSLSLGHAARGTEAGVMAATVAATFVARALPVWLTRAIYGPSSRSPAESVVDELIGGGHAERELAAEASRRERVQQHAETIRQAFARGGVEAAIEVWIASESVARRLARDPRGEPASPMELALAKELPLFRDRVDYIRDAHRWVAGFARRDKHTVAIAVPVMSAGEVRGALVAERPRSQQPFRAEDEALLAEHAAALAPLLEEIRRDAADDPTTVLVREERNEDRATLGRIDIAAEAERRRVASELNATQEHLIGISVNLRLAGQLLDEHPEETIALLTRLEETAEEALRELHERVRSIYPSLLRARGLRPALELAASRLPLRTTVEVTITRRYRFELESAVYLCCVDALQNAAKYGDPNIAAKIEVWEQGESLCLRVSDEYSVYHTDDRWVAQGDGIGEMRARLTGLGAELVLESHDDDHETGFFASIPLRAS